MVLQLFTPYAWFHARFHTEGSTLEGLWLKLSQLPLCVNLSCLAFHLQTPRPLLSPKPFSPKSPCG
jgi:hypothetical protein